MLVTDGERWAVGLSAWLALGTGGWLADGAANTRQAARQVLSHELTRGLSGHEDKGNLPSPASLLSYSLSLNLFTSSLFPVLTLPSSLLPLPLTLATSSRRHPFQPVAEKGHRHVRVARAPTCRR
jgi:hypothetical protein